MRLEKPHEALELLQRALRRHPRDQEIIKEFSVLATQLGQPEIEVRAYLELEPLVPDNAILLAYFGQALGEIGQYERSLKMYERALAISPDVASIRDSGSTPDAS